MPIPLFDLPKIADHSSSCKSRVGFPFVIFWLKRELVSTGQPSTNIDHPPSLAFFDPTLFLQHDVRLLHSQGGYETIFFFNLCQSTYFTVPKQTFAVSFSVRKIFPSPDQCSAWPNLSKNAKMDLTRIPCLSPPVQQAIAHLRIYVNPIYNFSNCVRPPFRLKPTPLSSRRIFAGDMWGWSIAFPKAADTRNIYTVKPQTLSLIAHLFICHHVSDYLARLTVGLIGACMPFPSSPSPPSAKPPSTSASESWPDPHHKRRDRGSGRRYITSLLLE